ncbi:hypothetical protein BDV97DRAFT_366144 [Delphinella strobiligena]|nr:hypothetical protein BDV97DRAFT_366144 [Delphinella strobiligena]
MSNVEEMVVDTRLMNFKQYLPGLIDSSVNEPKKYEADLVVMGYNRLKVRQFLGGRSTLAKELLLDRMPDPERNRKGIYKALNLYGKDHRSQGKIQHHINSIWSSLIDIVTGWVLLDPFKCDLDAIAKQDLPLILKLAFYKPGNAYYLEYNVKGRSVRMRPASTCLKGKRIDYTLSGPVMLEAGDASDGEAETLVKDNIEGMVMAMS